MNLDGFLYIAVTTPMLVITMVLILINYIIQRKDEESENIEKK
mgnify:CR=1 FL=1